MNCWHCNKEIPDTQFRCNGCALEHTRETGQSNAGAWTRRTNIEREKYAADIAQPMDKHGNINKNYVKKYGTSTYETHFKEHPSWKHYKKRNNI